MSDADFESALATLDQSASTPSRFHEPFVRLFPVSGATVATIGNLLGSETIAASDDLGARIDELQMDLGEGPCWDAMNSGLPVIEPYIRTRPHATWPAFSAAILGQPVNSMFAFPLRIGSLRLGAVDLYSTEPVDLSPIQTRQASTMADVVSRHVLRRALHETRGDHEHTGNAFSRRIVHQATGMLIAQLRISSEEAALIMQGHAFADDRSMMQVAQDILDKRMVFGYGENGIEVVHD